MKRYISAILVIVILALPGCRRNGYAQMNVCLKQDDRANSGIAAAVYDDRIYYVSNELGVSGVYSMSMDGSGVRLEAENPSVISLQVFDGELTYCGIYSANSEYKSTLLSTGYRHKLYFESIYPGVAGSRRTADSVNKSFADNRNGHNFNLIGYHNSNGNLLAVAEANGKGTTHMILSCDDTAVSPPQYSFPFDIDYPYHSMDGEGKISVEARSRALATDVFSDLAVIYGRHDNRSRDDTKQNYRYLTGLTIIEIVDMNTGEEPYYVNGFQEDEILSFLFMDNGVLYCSYFEDNLNINKGMLIAIDINKKSVRTNIPKALGKNEGAVFATEHDGQILVVTEDKTTHDKMHFYAKSQKLHTLDPSSIELTELISLEDDSRILSLSNGNIIILNGSVIYGREIQNGKVSPLKPIVEISDPAKSIKNNDRFHAEAAGGWLFLYRIHGGYSLSYNEDMGQRLLYKINLNTGELIENDRELDFSELDPYRIESTG